MDIVTIRHLTKYRYSEPVWFGEHMMMFRPRESFDQHVLKSELKITPEPTYLRYHHDVFGNCVGIARFGACSAELVFESTVELEHTPECVLDQPVVSRLNTYPFAYGYGDLPDVHSSIVSQYLDPEGELRAWARSFLRDISSLDATTVLAAMTNGIHEDFKYVGRTWGPPHPPVETLRRGEGTCRDFAVLMMEGARALGLAARFVSGYLFIPDKSDGVARQGGASTHAWVRVFLPTGGWIEFDPTNGIIGNRDLIRVAVVRHPHQAVTLSGTWEGARSSYHGMEIDVTVHSRPVEAELEATA